MNRTYAKKIKKYLIILFRTLLVIGLCYTILKPIIQYILYAFMSPEDFTDWTVSMIPKNWSLYYWQKAAEKLNIFGATGLRSILFSVTIAVLQVVSSMVVGYGLARFDFKGKKFLTVMLFIVMLVPGTVIQLPQYFQFRFFGIGSLQLNLINTVIPYYILSFTGLGLKQALYIFLFKALFEGLPNDLENAAYVDGAGVFKTFFYVALPNAKSLMITIFLFGFCWTWTNSSYATAFYPNVNLVSSTLLKLDSMLVNGSQSSGNITYAGIILEMIPMLILMVFCQKHIIKSISTSGMAN